MHVFTMYVLYVLHTVLCVREMRPENITFMVVSESKGVYLLNAGQLWHLLATLLASYFKCRRCLGENF